MKFVWLVVLWLGFSFVSLAQTPSPGKADAATEKELAAIAQELFDAVAIGNKAPWEKYLADDMIYTDSRCSIGERITIFAGRELNDGNSFTRPGWRAFNPEGRNPFGV